ncbi:hypothetical protein [Thalassobacter stenotrophicus]|uniref:Uncharacterized protein n=2 Tax=Thalassobacter stenotrophicus TaxID=266809 RepID=A0A0P1EZ31_9RHOB|nr:hypothetical protein [Thalassobacter stenotrophicus]CUH60255.1 hypothetical protein THS5294_01544 [Thalassobacter stenotrophicus]SHI71308.1 hypothetical protein SAMN02744035_01335 [Thalassobacter stenotrophicus DSM 16310]
MTDNRADNMKRLNADPEFAAKRDQRARERFKAENDRLQRMANIAKRGCDVPARLEADWKSLKQMKITNREAASMLNIPWLGEPEDENDARWASRRACDVVDELIDLVETNARLDPDLAYELVERGKRIQRILAWNTQGQAL